MHRTACSPADDALAVQLTALCFPSAPPWHVYAHLSAPLQQHSLPQAQRGKGPRARCCRAPQCHSEAKYLFLTLHERGEKKKKAAAGCNSSPCKVTGSLPKGFSESRNCPQYLHKIGCLLHIKVVNPLLSML